jgi:addiction module HigA family antidote
VRAPLPYCACAGRGMATCTLSLADRLLDRFKHAKRASSRRVCSLITRALPRSSKAVRRTESAILRGSRGITADTALRLARFCWSDPRFWMNLQRTYDLVVAERDIADELKRIGRVS